jgi:hypothetical protein
MKKAKYLVEVCGDNNEIIKQVTFHKRNQIALEFGIPLYIVDKVIKISNDFTFKTKRKSHKLYQDLIKQMKIYIIKPTFNLNSC